MKKSPLTQLIIALVVLLCVFVALGFWYNLISAKSVAVANLQSQIDAKTTAAEHIASAQAALAEIAGDEAAVRAYFVPDSNVVSFIDDLQARGRVLKSNVNVISVAASHTAVHPSLELTLTITGTFDAVMRTVGAIEYAPYDLSITALALGQTDKNVWHADVKLLVGSAAASAGSAATSLTAPLVHVATTTVSTQTATPVTGKVIPKPN